MSEQPLTHGGLSCQQLTYHLSDGYILGTDLFTSSKGSCVLYITTKLLSKDNVWSKGLLVNLINMFTHVFPK
jgi:hypothetical protein